MVGAIWLVIAKASSLSALAALIAFTCLPFLFYLWRGDMPITGVLSLLTIILIFRHHENITRLIKGNEEKSSLSDDDQARP